MIKRLSQKGMSLVEIMVVAAILGFLGLAVSTTFTDIFRMQSRITGNDEANEFSASLGRFLFSESTCTEALVGKVFPVNGSGEVSIPGYVGYNAGADGMTEVKKDVTMGNKLKIKSLVLADKKMPVETIVYENGSASRYLAGITLVTESRVGQNWNVSPPRNYEFPILVDPASKKIIRCMTGSSAKDACAALGAEFDPVTGKCAPRTQCFYEGSFTTHECNPSAPSDCPPNVPNPISGGITCPSGAATKSKTGESAWSFVVSCGKKCSQTIQVQAKYYICLKCQ